MIEQKKEVLFDPSPKQKQFLKSVLSGSYRAILFGGAIRGGKTYAGLGALLLLCRIFPGSRWAVVRDSLPTLKRNTIPAFVKICPRKFTDKFNQETMTWTATNGSQILFFPENYDDDKELNRWKGLEVNGFLLEECNELQELSFWKAIERAGSFILPSGKKKPPPIVMMTCNPANNWVKKLFYDRYMGKEDEFGNLQSLPPTWLYIPSKITDNPFVMEDKDYVESLKMLPTYQYQVFVEGDWDIQLKVGGEYFKCFELDKHVRRGMKYDPSLPLHISWDDNFNPYLPCGFFQVHIPPIVTPESRTEIWMVDEIAAKSPNNRVRKVCDEIIRKYPNHVAGMYIYGDATADKEDTKMEEGYNFYRLIMDYLKKYKPTFRVISHNPNVVMRQNWMNSVFEKEVGGLRIIFDKGCETAINDCILLKEDQNGGKFKQMGVDPTTKVRAQIVGHFADLIEYFMVSCFALEFERYQAGDAITSVRFGKNASSTNNYDSKIKKKVQSKNSY